MVRRRWARRTPSSRDRRDLIARVTEDEEVRFRATLKRGMKILDERFDEMRAVRASRRSRPPRRPTSTPPIGFPLDLTQVICAESNFGVDVQGAGKRAVIKGADEA